MAGVAQRMQMANPQLASHSNHRAQGFRGVAESPNVPGQHVARGGVGGCLEGQARTAQETPICPRLDQVRAGWPSVPFSIAESEE